MCHDLSIPPDPIPPDLLAFPVPGCPFGMLANEQPWYCDGSTGSHCNACAGRRLAVHWGHTARVTFEDWPPPERYSCTRVVCANTVQSALLTPVEVARYLASLTPNTCPPPEVPEPEDSWVVRDHCFDPLETPDGRTVCANGEECNEDGDRCADCPLWGPIDTRPPARLLAAGFLRDR